MMKRAALFTLALVPVVLPGVTLRAACAPGTTCSAPVSAAAADHAAATHGLLAADSAALRAAVQARLDALHAAGRFPGVGAAIVLPDGGSIAVVSGVADRATGEPLSPDSRFLAGSVGKTFFAALALQLVDEGRLDLDAPIARYLGPEPWFDRLPNARATTVRMLMNHTSGLVRYEFDPRVTALLTAEPDKVWTPEERLSYLYGAEPPFAAGEGWEYSDTNYIVLAMILERITGTPAYDEIERRYIVPLGLRNTIPSDRRVLPGVVQGLAGAGNAFGGRDAMIEDGRFIVNPQMEWAGGGYASAPLDLARWAAALYSGRFHQAATLRAMLEPTPGSALGPNAGYGLGVIVRTTDLGPAHGHSGFFPGYLTEVRHYPDHGITVAVQFNTSVNADLGRGLGSVLHDLAELAVAQVTR